jgi:glutamate/tyrosine decarboxylase-like PLP-dependent enzyme
MERSYDEVLSRASEHARRWLDSVPTRRVPAVATVDEMVAALGGALPDGPTDPVEVVDLLAKGGEQGLVAMGSGRFFGFVIGGVLPAALGADWLVSAWDQNTGLRAVTPTTVAAEQVAGEWLCEVLGLPAGSAVGFTTGATMANFNGLAAARRSVLAGAGWDVNASGLQGAPRVRVLAGAERHDSVDLDLRYLGLGLPELVPSDDQGRLKVDGLAAALANGHGPTIVVLQAGNVHTGAFDPVADAIALAHEHGAWVHVDGAFGLWAAAVPDLRPLVEGIELADSWGTDAHKTLNVPYDCGVSIVRDPQAIKAAVSVHAAYLQHSDEALDPFDLVPDLSRRARGVPVWAALRSLGRSGVVDLVAGLVRNARLLTEGLLAVPGVEVLNDVVFTQISFAVGDQERTDEVIRRLQADGTAWIAGSRWQGRPILRISVSNAWTDDDDVAATVDAVRRALA